MTEKFIIGQIGSPFGIKGFVKIRSSSGEINHLLKLESVLVSKDGKEKLLQIEEATPAGGSAGTVLIRFKGIDSPEAAKTLNGAQLLAERGQAAPLGDGEFYIEDLKGLPVCVNNEEVPFLEPSSNLCALCASAPLREGLPIIGFISDIIEGGSGELMEIKLSGGEKRLVPFRKEFFPEISPEKGRVLIQNLWILE